MATHQILFGTLDLTEYIEVQDENVPNRLNVQLVPKRHGGVVSEVPVFGPRTVRLQGSVYSPDGTKEALRNLIKTIEVGLGTTRKKLYYFSDRYYNAYKSGMTWMWVPGSAMLVAKISIEFLCDDPFEYTSVDPSAQSFILTSGHTPVDITNNIYKRTVTLTNNGNYFAYFISTVTADQGNAVVYSIIRNNTISRNNQYTGTVVINDAVVIDNGGLTVKNDGVDDLANWNGSWLWLNAGINTLELEGNPGTYSFIYRERY
jgi:hypothetical protein